MRRVYGLQTGSGGVSFKLIAVVANVTVEDRATMERPDAEETHMDQTGVCPQSPTEQDDLELGEVVSESSPASSDFCF